ncbi:bifunctional 2-polyprenyl-6-hydroxyphenol methylase/3-demethylubiquinol 3-O-methyltransferase UbiG [Algihabitans albus]|uniref:bifunctional 2-polyprenyl-6-hydroxyphenol methylase/3-demethylubiquinol 3-O-methyltransferase UbiG n=1 Tax=Algihabitans albus TaxID=2164067 RepID=UPI000E5CD5F9|nr:bifunctional 2-polyprenyl-6-hydroxyphenol methylase/3-demethylubiquinol 3-O-methyltransferase UbiG [Algihabitans albus]
MASNSPKAQDAKPQAGSSSVLAEEVEKFGQLAATWWDPEGEMRPLHRLNPTRLAYLRDTACRRFGRDPRSDKPLKELKVLDIGCGGGLISEPLVRLGADVLGIDATAQSLEVARRHAVDAGLIGNGEAIGGHRLSYRQTTAEDLLAQGATFDLVVTLEVVEHVADSTAFLETCGHLVDEGGLLVLSTLSRTLKALALAKIGAEYLLRWLPAGTHDWRKFVRPHEAAGALRRAGLTVSDATGLAYNPLTDGWRLAKRDLDVNYMMTAVRD